MKHKILGAILCMAFLIMLVPPASAPAAQSSESVRLGLIYPLNQLDPLFVESSSEAFLAEQLFLGLVRLDENENLTPDLAESWEISDDGLEWIFYLREGIPWVDPNFEPIRDVIAEDVSFTMFRALEFGNFEEVLQGIEVIDDFTVQFSLRAPNPDFGTVLAVSPAAKVVPFDLVQEAGDAWTEPGVIWGAGSYLMVERTRSSVGLESNPFWKFANNYLMRSVLVEYTPDPTEALQQYLRSEFDMIELTPEIGEIVLQEPGLNEQVVPVEPVRTDLFSPMPFTDIQGIDHSYLAKPYLLPATSGYFGLARIIHWGFDTQPSEVQIPGTTRVMDDETLGALQSMTDDQSRLVFERMTPQLSLIFIDDIIVGGSTLEVGNEAAPFGFLRRVVDTYSDS
jgi:ABC-type transport system substrate-binding protein